jgi:hypothetical protein
LIPPEKQTKKKPLLDKEEGFEYEDNIPEGFEIDSESVVNLFIDLYGKDKLKINKQAIEEDMTRGQIIPFPKLNLSDSFIERFKDICREIILDGDPIEARTFLKKFIEKITLTRNACNVAYNLAGVVPTNEDCSSLREGLVELNGIEPSAS